MAFYNQTLAAVAVGRASMQQAGLPIRRPNDYFCENVKTDAHMTKVRLRFLYYIQYFSFIYLSFVVLCVLVVIALHYRSKTGC